MVPTDFPSVRREKTAQHPAAREREVQVQLIDAPHQPEISIRDRARPVINCAATDPKQPHLPVNGQLVMAVYHRLALNSPASVSTPSKKTFSSVSSPILACSAFAVRTHVKLTP
jgi:hypothetical protein